ncbi:MAG: SDR family oxidoreductase [Planctomycetes bacterium]|nr:SDR family oxidoreductase [Planctomycetota bacterium]
MAEDPGLRQLLVTGGAGYVGAVLVPRLLERGYRVRVLDLYLYGKDVLAEHPRLEQRRGDLRDQRLLREALRGCDGVVHLACVSNDASFALNPALGRSINYEAFTPLVDLSREAGVRRFVYASTSSVYGLSEARDITEDHPLVPITDYNRYKGLCEPILLERSTAGFVPVIVRPATVCGWSPRQRLDLTVNILTAHAVTRGRITVFGGEQMRPNIHIQDMVEVYLLLLGLPDGRVAGRVYNAGYENATVASIAERVRRVVREEAPDLGEVEMVRTPSDDVRSYHISSERIRRELGFAPRHTLEDAVRDLVAAFRDGRLSKDIDDPRYHNVRCMKAREEDLAEAPP